MSRHCRWFLPTVPICSRPVNLVWARGNALSAWGSKHMHISKAGALTEAVLQLCLL